MSSQVFAHDGNAVFEGVWTAITAAKSFNTNLLNVPANATHWVRYTTGGTAALSVGETLTGGTSSKTCKLVAQAVEVGTAGSSDTGIIFVNAVSGTFQGETLTGGTSTGTVAIAQDFIALNRYSPHPKTLLVAVETASLHCTVSGVTPTATAGTNHGVTIPASGSWVVRGVQNIRNFKAINETNANGSIMKYILYY